MANYDVIWKASSTVSHTDSVYPCRQVYVWLVTQDEQVVIVSKDGTHWQMPGGKPEIGESLTETAVREVYEETGLDITTLSERIGTFGYYIVKEPGATPACYLQIRCLLNLPSAAADLVLRVDKEDDEQSSEDVILYTQCVPLAELAQFIPWMPQSGEYRYLSDHLSLPLS